MRIAYDTTTRIVTTCGEDWMAIALLDKALDKAREVGNQGDDVMETMPDAQKLWEDLCEVIGVQV